MSDRICPKALQLFVYAVSAAIAEVELGQRPVQPRSFREMLLQQIADIGSRSDLDRHDVAGLTALGRRMVEMADDPLVRGRFRS